MANPVVVKVFFSRYDAEQAKGLLDEQAITSVIASDDCGGFYSGLTLSTGNVRLLVGPADLQKARETLEVLDQEQGLQNEEGPIGS